MIIVRLKGALGNQMFEYAFGRALAIKNNVSLKLDTTGLKSGLHHYSFDLQHLNIAADIATEEEISAFKKYTVTGFKRLAVDRLLPRYKRSVITEKSFSFEEGLLNAGSEVYLQGYWQSPMYFQGVDGQIREDFRIKYDPDPVNQKYMETILSVNAISLHVRRGDYSTIQQVKETHGLCSIDYYDRCIAYLQERVENPEFFVFSDDIEWAKANLNIPNPVTYLDHNGSNIDHGGTERCYEDIRLMSCCSHHIIANSSFSWWGSWLNPSPDKIVCAPKQWAVGEDLNTRDRIPDNWIRL